MNEIDWFYLASWLAILFIGYVFRKMPAVVVGSIFGIWVGLQFYNESPFITLVFLVLNIYTAYNGLELWDG